MPPVAPDRFGAFAAIDWSGAIGARQRGLAIALCWPGHDAPSLIRPEHVWSRSEVLAWVATKMPADTLVGVDFGPSLPFVDADAFFPGWAESPRDARSLWALVDRLCAGDPNLAASSFVDHAEAARHYRRHHGRKGEYFSGRGRLRQTEVAQRIAGLNPYSNLNLVGAAQVGKSSLTGMRVLHRLGGAIPIWPFDAPGETGSVIVEIYTSLAALAAGRPKGRSKMRTIADLNAALANPAIASALVPGDGVIEDHKSDAILTAAWLRRVANRQDLWTPAALTRHIAVTEGWTFGVA